jgi:hypothetical protein
MNNPKPAHPEPGPHERPTLPALRSTRFPYTVRQTSAIEADIYDAEGDFFVGGELQACNVIVGVFNAAYAEQNHAYAASPSPAPDHHTTPGDDVEVWVPAMKAWRGGKHERDFTDQHGRLAVVVRLSDGVVMAFPDQVRKAVPAPSPDPTPDKAAARAAGDDEEIDRDLARSIVATAWNEFRKSRKMNDAEDDDNIIEWADAIIDHAIIERMRRLVAAAGAAKTGGDR